MKELLHWDTLNTVLFPVWEKLYDFAQEIIVFFDQAGEWLRLNLFSFMLDFAFYYPLFMAYLWIIGALIYYFHWERKEGLGAGEMPVLPSYPPVSIIVPCHNESEDVRDTIEFLLQQKYPDFDIIAVNDGSTDNTLEVLTELAHDHEKVRVINLETNQGKAVALKTAALLTKSEFLVCIDGDALLAPEALCWMMRHFLSGPRVAAVTGNPRIRTRTTLLGRIQVGEFSAIIGMIKRAQRIYGRIFTVSGVVAAFRKSALHRVGYWSNDMITEDIDISWKLQLDHWDIRYEPHALCWILMPETLRGLWKQRVRWAQGGVEVLLRYYKKLGVWHSRRMWMVYLEYFISVFWAYTMLVTFLFWVAGHFIALPEQLVVPTMLPSWGGVLLGLTCLLQFAVSLFIDARYEKGIGKIYFWLIWYPLVYWVISVLTTVSGFIMAIVKKKGARAIWVSPDRGVR